MHYPYKAFAMTFVLFLLSACSSYVNGKHQTLTVVTPEVEGAYCTLTNEKGASWKLASTPGTVTIRRGQGPLSVICSKPGYKQSVDIVQPQPTNAMMANLLLGGGGGALMQPHIPNAVIAGLVLGGGGAIRDLKTGASHDYPAEIVIWMEPRYWQDDQERDEWKSKKLFYERDKQEKARQCRFSALKNC